MTSMNHSNGPQSVTSRYSGAARALSLPLTVAGTRVHVVLMTLSAGNDAVPTATAARDGHVVEEGVEEVLKALADGVTEDHVDPGVGAAVEVGQEENDYEHVA